MTGDQQDQISLAAQMAEKLIQIFEDVAGEVLIIQQIFNNSSDSNLFIDGAQISQADLDSIESFNAISLKVEQVVAATYSIGAFKDNLSGSIANLRGLARLE